MTACKSREHFLSRNGFSTVGIGNRKEQILLLLRRERKAHLIILGKDRDIGALLKGNSLKYDLSPTTFPVATFMYEKIFRFGYTLWGDGHRDPSKPAHRHSDRQIEGAYLRVRLNAWLGKSPRVEVSMQPKRLLDRNERFVERHAKRQTHTLPMLR